MNNFIYGFDDGNLIYKNWTSGRKKRDWDVRPSSCNPLYNFHYVKYCVWNIICTNKNQSVWFKILGSEKGAKIFTVLINRMIRAIRLKRCIIFSTVYL